MGGIVDAVFGGSAKDASRAQVESLDKAMRETRRSTKEAKDTILPMFDEAEQTRLARTQQAADILSEGFLPQLDVMSSGNMNAQQVLAGAAPQMQNAILGGPVNYSFMQPQGIDFNAAQFLGGLNALSNVNAAGYTPNDTDLPDIPLPDIPPPTGVPNNQRSPVQTPQFGFGPGQQHPISGNIAPSFNWRRR